MMIIWLRYDEVRDEFPVADTALIILTDRCHGGDAGGHKAKDYYFE